MIYIGTYHEKGKKSIRIWADEKKYKPMNREQLMAMAKQARNHAGGYWTDEKLDTGRMEKIIK